MRLSWAVIFAMWYWGTAAIQMFVNAAIDPTYVNGVAWNIFLNLGGFKLWGVIIFISVVCGLLALTVARNTPTWAIGLLAPLQFVMFLSVTGVFTALSDAFHTQFPLSLILQVGIVLIGIAGCYTGAMVEYYFRGVS
ncbi:hypothetical protein CMI37_03215 [Candidatus Pacearchaeota archaeon]|nr:hypothetical protein [Candidatus Pacearchaeota archaeon]|tara:strand:- start:188 stop:598 length:411 start_codon:yes stop_codon:yes gene_type:complete